MPDWPRAVDEAVKAHLMKIAALEERVCEAALGLGVGALIITDGDKLIGSPSDKVPFGHLYRFPTMDSYETWKVEHNA